MRDFHNHNDSVARRARSSSLCRSFSKVTKCETGRRPRGKFGEQAAWHYLVVDEDAGLQSYVK